MKRKFLLCSLALVLALAARLAAQDEQEPGRKLRQGEVRGTVIFSDGSAITGVMHCTGFKPLKIFDSKRKKFRYIPLEHMAGLKVEVTKAQMVEHWRFKEESKDEKVYTGRKYPRKDYLCLITLRGGQKLKGTCTAVLYIEAGDEKTRFSLKHYDRGKTGETLEDLVHVSEIRIADPDDTPPDNRIFGTVKPKGRLQDVIAVQHRYKMFLKGKVNRETGEYVIKDLLPGCYDLVIVTDDSVFLCPGMKGEDFAEDSLTKGDKEDIAKRVWEIEDFFEEKKVLHATGNAKRAKVIVKAVRRRRTSLEKKGDPPLAFFHIEYWVMHKVGRRWLVDWRIQLVREKGEQETKKDTKNFVLRPELADKEIKAGGTRLRVDLDLSEADSGDEDEVIGR